MMRYGVCVCVVVVVLDDVGTIGAAIGAGPVVVVVV